MTGVVFFIAFGLFIQQNPITLEYISSFSVQDGYSYELISVSNDMVIYQEFYTKEIIKNSFDGLLGDTLSIPTGRGPGEYSGSSNPIKASKDHIYVLDRNSVKVLKFSIKDFQFVNETLTPPGPWRIVVNDEVYIRSVMSEKFYSRVNLEENSINGLSGADWNEPYHRLQNIFSFEAHDLATSSHLYMVKMYDAVYYIYDLIENKLRLIRFEDNPPVDFRNSDFMGNLRLHIRNAAMFGNGQLLGLQGYGRGSNGRAYHANTIHFFEPLTGKYIGFTVIPGVDIALGRMVANEEYLAILDSNSNRINIYKYYINE